MSSRFRRKYRGFTLIELLVVIAIIGLLATLAVVAFGNARARARDAKRIADITEIDKVIRLYYDEHGVYPGQGTTAGQKISPNCLMFSIVTDLQSSGYMPKVPMDPADDGTCTFGNDANYYYAWDTTHTGGYQCFSINNLETTWAEDLLISKYGQLKVLTEGGDANMNTADFNWCYE